MTFMTFYYRETYYENATEAALLYAQWVPIFYLSLLSHTQKTVVTLTQSHTPTTTVSQRTHRPTD